MFCLFVFLFKKLYLSVQLEPAQSGEGGLEHRLLQLHSHLTRNNHHQAGEVLDETNVVGFAEITISILRAFFKFYLLQSWLMIASPSTADGVGALIVHLFTNRFLC